MSELTTALAELATDPAAVVESPEVRPETLEKMRRAFSLHLAGETYDEIGEALDVSRATVGRLLAEYREAYRRGLESSPKLHLVSQRLSEYENIARQALADMKAATSDRAKSQHRRDAIAALKAYDYLALESGVFNREPDKVYSLTQQLKPAEIGSDDREERDAAAVRQDIDELLKHARTLG